MPSVCNGLENEYNDLNAPHYELHKKLSYSHYLNQTCGYQKKYIIQPTDFGDYSSTWIW